MIVLDASAVIELLLRTSNGDKVARAVASQDQTLHAPHLLDLEVAQVLRRYCISEGFSTARATEALADLGVFDIQRYAHEPLLERIWQLRANLTAYDAAYVALAEALQATLLTFDARLAKASGHSARIELL